MNFREFFESDNDATAHWFRDDQDIEDYLQDEVDLPKQWGSWTDMQKRIHILMMRHRPKKDHNGEQITPKQQQTVHIPQKPVKKKGFWNKLFGK